MTTFERIKFLAKQQGKSLNKVEADLGYGKNVLYRLKNSNPSAERLEEIADYFNVTVDYLLGRTESPNLKHYGDNTFAAIAKSFKADNPAYTQLFESLPLLSDEEIIVVNNMVQSLIELKQKKS